MAKKPAILRSRGRPLPPPNFGPTTDPGAPDSPCKLQIISSAVLWCLSQQGFYTKKSKTTAPSFQFSRKRDGKWEALGRSCVVLVQRRTVENGGTFQTFREEKHSKNSKNTIRKMASAIQRISSRLNIPTCSYISLPRFKKTELANILQFLSVSYVLAFLLCCLFSWHLFLVVSWLGICVEMTVHQTTSSLSFFFARGGYLG